MEFQAYFKLLDLFSNRTNLNQRLCIVLTSVSIFRSLTPNVCRVEVRLEPRQIEKGQFCLGRPECQLRVLDHLKLLT